MRAIVKDDNVSGIIINNISDSDVNGHDPGNDASIHGGTEMIVILTFHWMHVFWALHVPTPESDMHVNNQIKS